MNGFNGYDAWKLRSPDDEADERERKRQRAAYLEERADEMRDREKDERYERDEQFNRFDSDE